MTKKLYLLLAGMTLCFSLLSQTESEVLSMANKHFKNEKYVAATPLYLRLLSLSPKNTDYNFRYGTCLLFNADKKQEALRYLKFAAEDPNIDPLAYYFLGKAYHVNYLFNDAVRSYDKFSSEADSKVAENYPTRRLIETCQNGRKLLMNYSEMIVFEKKEIEAEKFFRLYNLDGIGGNIIVTADYQSKLDKKNGHVPLVYFGKGATEIYYSSYGESGNNGKDIYRKKREPTGAWGKSELIKGQVNTKYDEDFCYRSQDGQYLYFSSKGHNSMGGYDVFRSSYDESSDSYGEPENMDFAVSSPDDDIFFLVDAKNENGYFASARQSEVGKLYVYKIRVDKLPTQLSVIAGRYESKISTTPPKLKVQVENPSGVVVGNFESDENGQIILSFPTGGQYKYRMKLQGSSEEFMANVNVPYKRNIKPIRQSFMHFKENDKEVVRVLDRFDETVIDKDDVLAALFAEKAKLDPNSDKFDLNGLNNRKEEQRILADVGAEGWTMSEVATEMEGKARAIRVMEDAAGNTEKKAASLIEEEIKIIEDLNVKLAQNASNYRDAEVNSMTRQNLLIESKELLAKKVDSEDKIQDLLDINRKVQENLVLYKDIKLRAADWEKKGAELQQLLLEDKNTEALQLIALNKVIINSAITDKVKDYQTVTTHDISALNKELTSMNSMKFNYETSSKDLRNNIDYLERNLMEGKADDPEATKENIERKKKDLVVIHDEIDNIEKTVKTKRAVKEGLTDELSEYKELDNSPMPNKIAQMQTAKDHWKAVKNTPQQKESEYLAEVIQDIEDGNIAVVDSPREAKSTEELFAAVNPTFDESKNDIESNADLSVAEKAVQLEKLEQENVTLLADEIQKMNADITANPNDEALSKEKDILEGLLTQSQLKADKYQDTQEIEESKNIASTIDELFIADAIDNTYDDVKEHLTEDSNLDELAKLKALNDHDQAFVDKIDERKEELKVLLQSDKNRAPQYEKELQVLNDIAGKRETELASRSNEIENLENVAVVVESVFSKMTPKEQEQTLLNDLNKDYVSQKEAFDDISEPTVADLQSEISLDRKVMESLSQELNDLDPATQKSEIAAIERILVDTKSDISQNEIEVESLENVAAVKEDFSRLSVEEQEARILNGLNEDYVSKKAAFDNISEPTIADLQSKIALDREVIEVLNQELNDLDPTTQKSEIAAIERILADTKSDIGQNELEAETLENLAAVNSDFANLSIEEQEVSIINQLDENYLTRKKSFDDINIPTVIDLQTEIAADESILEALNEKLSNLNTATQANEIAAVQRIITETEADINDNTAAIEALGAENPLNLVAASETNKEIIDRISSDYTADINLAQNDTESTEIEKINKFISLDKDLITQLQKELDEVNALADENSDNENLIEKSIQLDEMIAEKSQLLASREETVLELENQLATTDPNPNTPVFTDLPIAEQDKLIRKNMDWSYEDQKDEIIAASANEDEKLEALIELDNSTEKMLAQEKAKLDGQSESAQIEAIERIEKEIQTSISNNKMNLLALPETSEELISRLDSDYIEQKEAIDKNNSLGSKAKLIQKIALEEKLIESLESEKNKYQRLGNDNPQVPALSAKANEIAEYIAAQNETITTAKNNLEVIENQLATTDPVNNPAIDNAFAQLSAQEQEEAMLLKVNENYKADKAELENEGLDSKGNLESMLALNTQTLYYLESEKLDLDQVASSAEIAAIERLEVELNEIINSTKEDLRLLPESSEEVLARLANIEMKDLEDLRDDVRLSELEKAEKTADIHQKITISLEQELTELEKLSEQDPDSQEIMNKIDELEEAINSNNSDLVQVESELALLKTDVATTNPTIDTESKSFKNIDEIRSELLADENLMQNDETSLEALKEQVIDLNEYEKDLQSLDSNYEYLETVKDDNFKKERRLIADELVEVENKKRIATITIGEIELEFVNANTVASATAVYDDPGLKRIVEEENELRAELDDEVSMKKARKIEKKLIEKIDERTEKENDITEKIIHQTERENVDKLEQLQNVESSNVTERLSLELTETMFNEINDEAKVLGEQAKNADTPQEEAELLAKALEKQMEASEMLESSYLDVTIDRLTKGKINSLMTNSELQSKRKNLLIEEANINAQIATLDNEIKLATKEKEQEELYKQRKSLVEKRTRVDNSIAQLDRKIADSPIKGKETLPAKSLSKELTYLEEREISETADYKELSTAASDALFLEGEIKFLLKTIDKEKEAAQELLQESLNNPSDEIDQLLLNKIQLIEEKQTLLDDLKLKLEKRQFEIDALMPKDPERIANINNMLARGVDPASKYDAVEFVAIPKEGFSIQTSNTPNTVKAKPIVTETPTGLMYRVQVGAFSKPVAEDVFNEFTPVSAEKRANGILVYMAGFFQGNGKAREAQKSIRKIGYTDAFVVAYCDGKRITLSEAKRLEETNGCTPIELTEIAIQAEAPKDTTKVMITELDYYKGIGAAQALPVETKKGLFYTVQLGVYNRPVGKEVLKNMSPLITKRLPNGQIRYSAGVYVSIEEAFPKREQAFDRGINDAYITAYYGGERITLSEAEKILQTEGASAIEKTAIGIVKDVESRLKAEQKLAKDIQEIVKNEKVEGLKIQLISKRQFDEFPRDILNRFNSHASFYFDMNDKRIKSNLYELVDDIPQIYFLRNELDTTYISDMQRIEKVIKNDLRNLTFEISSAQLGGDLTDLLLRLNYRKEFEQVGEVIKVRVHEIPTGKVQGISDRLRTLKIRSDVEDPAR